MIWIANQMVYFRFSIKCVELSNSVIRPKTFTKDVAKELTQEATIITSTDDFRMTNFYMDIKS